MMSRGNGWFDDARYGMFIHWGPYSVAARGEWVRNRERISQHEYAEKYANKFLAENYNPAEWAKLAVEAGMKYVVLTARHHDGFCLWDTKTTGFNAPCYGPGRDLVKPFVEAIRAAGLKVGLYYSYADWHNPDYPNPYARDWPERFRDQESEKRFNQICCAQLEELMTHYGKIDILWYDGCFPSSEFSQANILVKQLQPEIMINERNGPPFDFYCSEQAVHAAQKGKQWEACVTMNNNWGYHQGDFSYKSPQDIIRLLLQASGQCGNLLLNIGPLASGDVPQQAMETLRAVGKWLNVNGEFLHNSDYSPYSWNNSARLTTKGSKVYIHFFSSPGKEFHLAEIANRVISAHFLATGLPVEFSQDTEHFVLKSLPTPLPDPLITTVVVEVEGTPAAIVPGGKFYIPGS